MKKLFGLITRSNLENFYTRTQKFNEKSYGHESYQMIVEKVNRKYL